MGTLVGMGTSVGRLSLLPSIASKHTLKTCFIREPILYLLSILSSELLPKGVIVNHFKMFVNYFFMMVWQSYAVSKICLFTMGNMFLFTVSNISLFFTHWVAGSYHLSNQWQCPYQLKHIVTYLQNELLSDGTQHMRQLQCSCNSNSF